MQSVATYHHSLVQDFYINHNAWLHAWLRKKVGCTTEAADLMHDTYLCVLLKKDLTAILEPRAYLTHIAHGLLVTRIRRRDLEKSYLDALMHLSPTEVPSPELRLIVLETLVRLDAMLNGLPPKVRNAYLLLQLENLSYAEIAKKLGVSTRTVGSYIAKAILHCMLVKES
jgi:RNA polymerase sigma-19 factor, ECF subfamily